MLHRTLQRKINDRLLPAAEATFHAVRLSTDDADDDDDDCYA